jgi:hypothetical protein
MKLSALCLALLLLTGCAGLLESLQKTSLADAQRALQWATEDNDVIAIPCYTTLVEILESPVLTRLEREPNGVLTGVYLARVIRKELDGYWQSRLREKLLLGCSALLADQRDVLFRLGIKTLPLPF